MAKREVDILVVSDVHLGTYGCHARELLCYLKSTRPKVLILNGDIIDIWQFNKRYFPEDHMRVIRKILKFVADGVPVYYLTGNHDEMLRKFADFDLGGLKLLNKLVLNIGGEKAWFFHGDVFDITMQHSRWLARLGATGYDSLILLNSLVNWLLVKMGRHKYSFSQKIKARVKEAVKFINQFEQTAASLAIENQYSYVVCGHIHHAEIRAIVNENGKVTYLNSGDWVESLTSLEFYDGQWHIFRFRDTEFTDREDEPEEDFKTKMDVKELFRKFAQGVA